MKSFLIIFRFPESYHINFIPSLGFYFLKFVGFVDGQYIS